MDSRNDLSLLASWLLLLPPPSFPLLPPLLVPSPPLFTAFFGPSFLLSSPLFPPSLPPRSSFFPPSFLPPSFPHPLPLLSLVLSPFFPPLVGGCRPFRRLFLGHGCVSHSVADQSSLQARQTGQITDYGCLWGGRFVETAGLESLHQ